MDSTQNLALKFCKLNTGSIFSDSVILADEQINGYGRNNRKWISPFGGLWFSIILTSNIQNKLLSIIPLSIGLSIFKIIKSYFNIQISLKWPNDILYNNKKIVGIIIDTESIDDNVNNIIIGIGINVNNNSESMTQTLGEVKALSLSEIIGKEIDRFQLLSYIINQILVDLEEAERNGYNEILNEYKKNCITLGNEIKSKYLDDIGTPWKAIDIDEDGALVAVTKNIEKKIYTI